MTEHQPGAPAARMAERMVRVPLAIAGVVALALVMGAAGVPGMLAVARLGVEAALLAYLAAGVLNVPRFPRALRGPPTRHAADGQLLDLWTFISTFVVAVAINCG